MNCELGFQRLSLPSTHNLKPSVRCLPSPYVPNPPTHTRICCNLGASAHTELLRGEAAVQTSECRTCLDLSPGARTGSRGACKRCAQVEDIPQQQVAELQETARKLCDIRAAEEDLDSSLQKQSGGHTACGQTAQTSSFKRMGPDSFQQCPAAGEEARYTN